MSIRIPGIGALTTLNTVFVRHGKWNAKPSGLEFMLNFIEYKKYYSIVHAEWRFNTSLWKLNKIPWNVSEIIIDCFKNCIKCRDHFHETSRNGRNRILRNFVKACKTAKTKCAQHVWYAWASVGAVQRSWFGERGGSYTQEIWRKVMVQFRVCSENLW